jgi:2,3-dimethylmalate lyase
VHEYEAAGVAALHIEHQENEDEVAAVAGAFPDVPLVLNRVDGGRTPPLALDRIAELGFGLVILPVKTLFAATAAVRDTLARLRSGDAAAPSLRFDEFTDLVGLPELRDREARYTA